MRRLEFEGVSTSFIVSGDCEASITKLKKRERKPYSESTYGFSHLLVTKQKLVVRQKNQLHAFTCNLAGVIT